MNTATILKTPQDTYDDIKKHGQGVLSQSLITSPKDLIDTLTFLESCGNLPGRSEEITNLKNDCFQILKKKIELTKFVFNVTSNNELAIIPNDSQLNLNLQEVKESPEEVQTRTENKQEDIKKDNIIKHDFNKKDDKKENKNPKAVSFQGFKGYTRKVIFETATELPESVQKLVLVVKSESDIDNIARHLVEDGRVEDALNLSIDLFEKSEAPKKLQQEVEMRFINEILPWCYGITVKPFDSYQNITLAFWNNHLLSIVNNNKLIEDITIKATEEMKSGEITASTANEIATNFPNESDKIFDNVCKTLGIKLIKVAKAVDIIIPKDKEAIEQTSTVGLTYEALQKECISMFKSSTDTKAIFKEVKDFFDKELPNVVDLDKTTKPSTLWAQTVIAYKKSEKTVEDAEKAAYEGKDKLTPEEVKAESKSIITKAIEAGESAMNKLRQYLRQKDVNKAIGSVKVETYFNKLKEEIEVENPEALKKVHKPKARVISNFSVETDYPDVWETAIQCKTLGEFKDLILNIVFEKKELPSVKDPKKMIDGWQVAANLVSQYANKLEGSKDWDENKKTAWFVGLINATSEQRKKDKAKDQISEDATIVSETTKEIETVEATSVQEQIEVERSEQSSDKQIDLSKYDSIGTEKNNSKLQAIMANFLLETGYKTFKERYLELRDIYIPKNVKWNKAPEVDRDNVIKKVIKNNDKVREIAE